jgi:hypothetical protein
MSQASTQLTDSGTIPGGGTCRSITFVVAEPGPISVVSVPQPLPQKNQTETGLLGRIKLIRPGNPPMVVANVATAIGQSKMTLSYQPTPQDLAARGSWSCRICNETEFPFEFDTTLTIPPIPTASFDVGLFNSILALAAGTADLRIHLATTNDGSAATIASWSVALAGLLPLTPVTIKQGAAQIVLRNKVEARITVPDFDAFSVHVPFKGDVTLADGHIVNADSAEVGISLNGESIVLAVAFDTSNMNVTVRAHDTPLELTNISFQVFQAELSIDFDGRVTLDAQVVASATIAGNFIDLSQQVREKLLEKIQQSLPPAVSDPTSVKKALFPFVANVMRLNQIAVPNQPTPMAGEILDLAVDGRTLVASYAIVPVTSQTK